MATGHALRVVRVPGLLPYAAGLTLQLETRAAVAQGAPATLLLVEVRHRHTLRTSPVAGSTCRSRSPSLRLAGGCSAAPLRHPP